MKYITSGFAFALGLAIVLTALPVDANHVPPTRWATDHIPVKLATDQDNRFETIGVSTAEAERRLMRSISFLNTYLGSNMQLEYRGRGCEFDDGNDNVVCVHAWNCVANPMTGCSTSQGCASTTEKDDQDRGTDGWVRIVGGPGIGCGRPMVYSEYPWDVDLDAAGRWRRGTEDTLVGLLNHELFHIIGGPHDHTLPPFASALNNGGSENPITHYPSRWENRVIARNLYGSQTLDAAHAQSNDALSWEQGNPAWIGGRLYRFGSVTTGATFLGTAGTWYFDNAVYFKKIDSSGIGPAVRIDPKASGLSFSPASVAFGLLPNGSNRLLAVWLANESLTSLGADIRFAVSDDGGSSWPTTGYLLDSGGTRINITRKTVNAGFDWITGRFIVIWHDNSDRLSYVTMPATDPTDRAAWFHGQLPNYALDGASIACTNRLRDRQNLASNCLILWTEMHDSYCLTWRQGSLRQTGSKAGEFISSDLRTQCKQGWSVPSVTFNPGSDQFEFVMAWMNPDTGLFSMRKPQEKGFWRDERSFSTRPFFTSPPSIGTWMRTIGDPIGDDVSANVWELDMMYVRTP